MPALDGLVLGLLAPLAVWVLASGLDDVFLDLSFLYLRFRARFSPKSEPGVESRSNSQPRAAILVPCWQEAGVIGRMAARNLSAIGYSNYTFWIGVYPNDPACRAEALACASHDPRVRCVTLPHDGPTT